MLYLDLSFFLKLFSERFVDIPQPLNFSILCFHFPRVNGVPQSFGWLTGNISQFNFQITSLITLSCIVFFSSDFLTKGPGVLFGDVDISGKAGEDSVTSNTRLVPYPLSFCMFIVVHARK